jgi:DNA-binding NarL/FixJ family response regulator
MSLIMTKLADAAPVSCSVNPHNFDLVISDKGMPNMTGEQFAREIISIKPGIPIIICTCFCNENDELRAKAMGIKGFLMKPVATGKVISNKEYPIV